jgi:predicted phage terminase large subunit-like protein
MPLVFARTHPQDPDSEYVARSLAEKSLLDFITYTYPKYLPDDFHIKVCDILQNAMEGGERRIMIFAPPQHGKSEIVSVRFPTYWLAHKPDKPIILCSYGALLASNKQAQSRRILFSKAYRNVFDEKLQISKQSNPGEFLKYIASLITSTGVGGPITGFGAGLGIIDDPVKNYSDALSEGLREKTWTWYQTTFRTRIWENGILLLIMTRWHQDDLAGRLLNQQGEKWSVYRFPALAETQEVRDVIAEKQNQKKDVLDPLGRLPGQPLAPNRFSKTELISIEEEVGTLAWAAEYQGFPQTPGGNMFKEDWFQYIDYVPQKVTGRIRYWDKAATAGGGTRTVGCLMSYDGTWWTIEDIIKGQWSTWQRESIIQQTADQDEEMFGYVTIWLEEEGGSGGIDSALMSIKGLAGHEVKLDKPTKAKEIRWRPLATQAEAGHIRLVRAAWNKAYIAEMIMLPNSTYKDQADASSGAFLKLARRGWARGAGG